MAASYIGLRLSFACYHACNSLEVSLLFMLACVMQVYLIFSSMTIIPWNVFLLAYEVLLSLSLLCLVTKTNIQHFTVIQSSLLFKNQFSQALELI